MQAPTERLTTRTQQILGEDVVLAMRVKIGPPSRLTMLLANRGLGLAFFGYIAPVVSVLAMPFLGVARLLSRLRTGPSAQPLHGVLAILPSDERVLLRASDFRPSRPTEAIQRFPEATPLQPDVELMEKYMIAQLTLDGQAFIVNGIDFEQLLKKVADGTIPSVAIGSRIEKLRNVAARRSFPNSEEFFGE